MSLSNKVVGPGEYQAARGELLKEEKEATRLLQRLAASRRQLPMVEIKEPTRFKFDSLDGEKSLPDLFENRKQLIMYHFMLGSEDSQGCIGCTFCMDHIPDLHHLWSRDTSFVAVATAPIKQVAEYGDRMEWSFPFYSAAKTRTAWDEAEASGEIITWKPGNGYFGLSVFLKDGERVYHTYDTTDRGMESILSTYHLLDMTPLGRQEIGNGMGQFRRRDEY